MFALKLRCINYRYMTFLFCVGYSWGLSWSFVGCYMPSNETVSQQFAPVQETAHSLRRAAKWHSLLMSVLLQREKLRASAATPDALAIARPVHMHKIMCRFSQWIRPANLCKCRKMSQTCLFFLRLNLRSNPLDSREDWIWGFAFGDSLEALRNGKSGGRGWQAAWSSSPQVSHSLTTVHIWTPFCRWLIDSKSLLWCLQMISKLLGYLD